MDFKGFSTVAIADKTLQALGFHISTTGYLKEGSPHFIVVTDLELIAERVVVDNLGQVITESEEEVVKNKNKRTIKRKERFAKLCVLVESPSSPHPEFFPFSSACSMPALVPALVPAPISASVSCSESAAISLFRRLPAIVSRPRSPGILLSCCVPAPARSAAFSLPRHALISHCVILALLLPPPNALSSPLLLGFLPLRIFKRFLSDAPRPYMSTSPAKLLYLFPAFGTYNSSNNNDFYNPTNNNERKWDFNTIFINPCLLAGNHD